jgi:hypothetical protein
MSGILDALGYVGDSLDKLGGRPTRGLLGGHSRELASIIPFSDRLGITDPNDIVSGRDLTDKFGLTRKGDTGLASHALGFGAEALLDPTNLIGAGLFGKGLHAATLGKTSAGHGDDLAKALSRFHPNEGRLGAMMVPPGGGAWEKRLADAADAAGPGFEGGIPRLMDAIGAPSERTDSHVVRLLENPELSRIAAELPPDYHLLGSGAEALAFGHRSGKGSVLRVGPAHSEFLERQGLPASGRANIPEVLQPFRSTMIGSHLVEHLPRVRPIFDGLAEKDRVDRALAIARMGGASPDAVKAAHQSAQDLLSGARSIGDYLQGRISGGVLDQHPYMPWDVKSHNVSLTPQGNTLTHDAGAVWPYAWDEPIPFPHQAPYPSPDELALLREMNAHEAVRRAMQQGEAMANLGQGVPLPAGISGDQLFADRDALDAFLRKFSGEPQAPREPSRFNDLAKSLLGLASAPPGGEGTSGLNALMGGSYGGSLPLSQRATVPRGQGVIRPYQSEIQF